MKKHCVLYTDGGCRPNPGKMGAGIHGYIYDVSDVGKTTTIKSNYLPTNFGYFTKEELLTKKATNVKPTQYIDGILKFDFKGTNNVAEVEAIRQALSFIVEKQLKLETLLIFTDSQIAIGLYAKLSNPAVRKTYIKRSPLPDRILEGVCVVIDLIKEMDIDFKLLYIKGHSFNFGNTMADGYATSGIFSEKSHINIASASGYWKPANDMHPFIRGNYVLYKTNTILDDIFILNVKEADWIGRKDPKRKGYRLIKGIKPESIQPITDVCNLLNSVSQEVRPSAIKIGELSSNATLRNIFGPMIYRVLHNRRTTAIVSGGDDPGIPADGVVASIIKYGGLVIMADNLRSKLEIFDGLYSRDDNAILSKVDITSSVYSQTKKNGLMSVPAHEKQIKVKLTEPFKHTLILLFGVNLPKPEQLNKIKKDSKVKVELLIMSSNDLSFDYCIRTEIDGVVAYDSSDSNVVYNLNAKKL